MREAAAGAGMALGAKGPGVRARRPSMPPHAPGLHAHPASRIFPDGLVRRRVQPYNEKARKRKRLHSPAHPQGSPRGGAREGIESGDVR